MQENLISRPRNRFKTFFKNKKLKKSIASFILVSVMIFSMLAITGCNPSNQTNTSSTTNSTNPSSYSQILQDVLEGDYYARMFGDSSHISSTRSGIPYGFLEKENRYNIEQIKRGNNHCYTEIFVMDGDLYIALAVKDEPTTKSDLTCYMLRYTLSKQEKADMDMLFEGNYVQSAYFVQQLSYDRDPEVLSESKITFDAYQNLKTTLNEKNPKQDSVKKIQNLNNKYLDCNYYTFLFKGFEFDVGNYNATKFYMIGKSSNASGYSKTSGKLIEYLLKTIKSEIPNNTLIYGNPFNWNYLYSTFEDGDASKVRNITVYNDDTSNFATYPDLKK